MWKIQIPKTESKVEEATLIKWYKKEGDKIDKEELIAETETFKAVVEIHSPDAGIIYKIFVEEGETVAVNTVIAVIIEEGEKVSSEDIRPFLRIQKEEDSAAVKKGKETAVQKD
jgi:pyruvate dehydrogenase E2 component (dihydrolipoamide acetyltransferase)